MCLLLNQTSHCHCLPTVLFDLPYLLPSVECALLLMLVECAGSQICLLAQQMECYRLQSKCGNSTLLQMDIYEFQLRPQILINSVHTFLVLAGDPDGFLHTLARDIQHSYSPCAAEQGSFAFQERNIILTRCTVCSIC